MASAVEVHLYCGPACACALVTWTWSDLSCVSPCHLSFYEICFRDLFHFCGHGRSPCPAPYLLAAFPNIHTCHRAHHPSLQGRVRRTLDTGHCICSMLGTSNHSRADTGNSEKARSLVKLCCHERSRNLFVRRWFPEVGEGMLPVTAGLSKLCLELSGGC